MGVCWGYVTCHTPCHPQTTLCWLHLYQGECADTALPGSKTFLSKTKSQWSSAGLPNQAAFHVGFRTSVYLLGASILLFIWAPSSSPCIFLNASRTPLSMLSLEEKSGNCLGAQPFWRWVTFRGHLIDSHILIIGVSARLHSLVPTIIQYGEGGSCADRWNWNCTWIASRQLNAFEFLEIMSLS